VTAHPEIPEHHRGQSRRHREHVADHRDQGAEQRDQSEGEGEVAGGAPPPSSKSMSGEVVGLLVPVSCGSR
jgi:hypothetical protein